MSPIPATPGRTPFNHRASCRPVQRDDLALAALVPLHEASVEMGDVIGDGGGTTDDSTGVQPDLVQVSEDTSENQAMAAAAVTAAEEENFVSVAEEEVGEKQVVEEETTNNQNLQEDPMLGREKEEEERGTIEILDIVLI